MTFTLVTFTIFGGFTAFAFVDPLLACPLPGGGPLGSAGLVTVAISSGVNGRPRMLLRPGAK